MLVRQTQLFPVLEYMNSGGHVESMLMVKARKKLTREVWLSIVSVELFRPLLMAVGQSLNLRLGTLDNTNCILITGTANLQLLAYRVQVHVPSPSVLAAVV